MKVEAEIVNSKKVSCDGGKGPLGHPLIYLNMGNEESIVCPYCSKKFILKKGAKAAAH